jgi:hypothetical protein
MHLMIVSFRAENDGLLEEGTCRNVVRYDFNMTLFSS